MVPDNDTFKKTLFFTWTHTYSLAPQCKDLELTLLLIFLSTNSTETICSDISPSHKKAHLGRVPGFLVQRLHKPHIHPRQHQVKFTVTLQWLVDELHCLIDKTINLAQCWRFLTLYHPLVIILLWHCFIFGFKFREIKLVTILLWHCFILGFKFREIKLVRNQADFKESQNTTWMAADKSYSTFTLRT